jgi:hypothetical protein
VTLRQEAKTLRREITSTDPFEIDVEDLSQPRNFYDHANPGLSRVRIMAQMAPNQTGRFHPVARPSSIVGWRNQSFPE